MNHQIVLTVLEVFISLVVESTILAGVFSYISNKANEKQLRALQSEMYKIEQQNKLIYKQLEKDIANARNDILSQIKESAANGIS